MNGRRKHDSHTGLENRLWKALGPQHQLHYDLQGRNRFGLGNVIPEADRKVNSGHGSDSRSRSGNPCERKIATATAFLQGRQGGCVVVGSDTKIMITTRDKRKEMRLP